MSGFDARWKQLANAARRHERDAAAQDNGRIDACTAAAIAARSRGTTREFALSDLRGLAVAAGLCCACLSGLVWSANRFGFTLSVASAAHELAQVTRRAPGTSFIPPPPGLDALGLPLPELEPRLALRPGAAFLDFLDGWFEPLPPTTEIPR